MSRNCGIVQGRFCDMAELRQQPGERYLRRSLREEGASPEQRHSIALVKGRFAVTANVGEQLLERHLRHTFAHQRLQRGAWAPDREHPRVAVSAAIASIATPGRE